MSEAELAKKITELQEKLSKAQRQAAVYKEKSKALEAQYGDSRNREQHTNELVMQLLERQRELNVMLNRANIMLNRTQEAIALSSVEFNEMAKALPEPKKKEWEDRVARINELFKKTGIEDAELPSLDSPKQSDKQDAFDTDEIKKEAEQSFGRRETIWNRKEKQEPPQVEAELLEEETHSEPEPEDDRIKRLDKIVAEYGDDGKDEVAEAEHSEEHDNQTSETDDSTLAFGPKRKSWWQRLAG